ncbi:MAG: hypothetical protein E7288_05285 [Lachnospiraceae bacterium]|nr:hypothetical protein [Lachnospiraceae bacterium]
MKQTYELNREFRQLLGGNTEAFRNIYLLTVSDVYFHVKQIIHNEDEAQRMVVKIYKSMFIRLDQLTTAEESVKWMNKIMYTHLADWVSIHCSGMLMDEEMGRFDQLSAVVNTGHSMMLTDAETAILASRYFEHLLPIHALAGLAYFYDGLDLSLICDLFHCDDSVVNKRTRYILLLIDGYCKEYANENDIEIPTIDISLILLAYVLLFKDTVVPNPDDIYYRIVQELQ